MLHTEEWGIQHLTISDTEHKEKKIANAFCEENQDMQKDNCSLENNFS